MEQGLVKAVGVSNYSGNLLNSVVQTVKRDLTTRFGLILSSPFSAPILSRKVKLEKENGKRKKQIIVLSVYDGVS